MVLQSPGNGVLSHSVTYYMVSNLLFRQLEPQGMPIGFKAKGGVEEVRASGFEEGLWVSGVITVSSSI